MAFIQYYDQYRYLLRSNILPQPYPYNIQYCNSAPNLINESNCINNLILLPEFMCCDTGPCYDQTVTFDPSVAMDFTVIRLVSNVITFGINLDINILQPWGILIADDKIWVTSASSGLITCYNLRGIPLLPIVNVFTPTGTIAQVTGITHNYDLNSFFINNGPLVGSSALIVSTRDGTVNGYNSSIYPNNSVILINNFDNNSVYTGLVVVNLDRFRNKNGSLLYLADFYNQTIDVYDGNLNKLDGFMFIDQDTNNPIPTEYSPYNIVNLDNLLYVSYAHQRQDDNQYELLGSGLGYVSIFDLDGNFIKRFTSNGPLNAPWGITYPPSGFGYPSGSVMISNYGDGVINIFDSNGQFINSLRDNSYNTICLSGLRGITITSSCPNQLFWTGSSNLLREACVGTIIPRNINR